MPTARSFFGLVSLSFAACDSPQDKAKEADQAKPEAEKKSDEEKARKKEPPQA